MSLEHLFVVCLYYLFDIGCTAVRDLECVFVQDGVKYMVWGEVFSNHIEEASAHFCLKRLVEGWCEVHNFPLLPLPCTSLWLVTGGRMWVFPFEFVLVTALV